MPQDNKNAIRYQILRDLVEIGLATNPDTTGDVATWRRPNSDRKPVLVDILERQGSFAKIRVYSNDGTTMEVWCVPSFILGLCHQGDWYDGRFNHKE